MRSSFDSQDWCARIRKCIFDWESRSVDFVANECALASNRICLAFGSENLNQNVSVSIDFAEPVDTECILSVVIETLSEDYIGTINFQSNTRGLISALSADITSDQSDLRMDLND